MKYHTRPPVGLSSRAPATSTLFATSQKRGWAPGPEPITPSKVCSTFWGSHKQAQLQGLRPNVLDHLTWIFFFVIFLVWFHGIHHHGPPFGRFCLKLGFQAWNMQIQGFIFNGTRIRRDQIFAYVHIVIQGGA